MRLRCRASWPSTPDAFAGRSMPREEEEIGRIEAEYQTPGREAGEARRRAGRGAHARVSGRDEAGEGEGCGRHRKAGEAAREARRQARRARRAHRRGPAPRRGRPQGCGSRGRRTDRSLRRPGRAAQARPRRRPRRDRGERVQPQHPALRGHVRARAAGGGEGRAEGAARGGGGGDEGGERHLPRCCGRLAMRPD